MKRLLALVALILACVPGARAQSDDSHKYEFFAGYSIMLFDTLAGETNNASVNEVFGEKENLRGLNLELTRNVSRYVGVKFDYSLHMREDNFSRPLGSGTIDTTVQNFLGGIQIKDNSKDGARFKPFGHALFGVAVQKVDVDSPQLPAVFGVNDFHVNETSFAMAFGGGIDIKINDRFDARVLQADWNIIRRGDQQIQGVTPGQTIVLPGRRQDNLRLSFGIVIH